MLLSWPHGHQIAKLKALIFQWPAAFISINKRNACQYAHMRVKAAGILMCRLRAWVWVCECVCVCVFAHNLITKLIKSPWNSNNALRASNANIPTKDCAKLETLRARHTRRTGPMHKQHFCLTQRVKSSPRMMTSSSFAWRVDVWSHWRHPYYIFIIAIPFA